MTAIHGQRAVEGTRLTLAAHLQCTGHCRKNIRAMTKKHGVDAYAVGDKGWAGAEGRALRVSV